MERGPDKPVIEYPCIWSYKLIGDASADVTAIVTSVLGERQFELTPSRSSSAGKYLSHNLTVVVMDEPDRVGIYQNLSAHPGVRIVL